MNKYLKNYIIILIILIPLSLDIAFCAENKGSHELFLDLSTAYTKWKEGLWGSKNFYRRQVAFLLSDNIGKEILTDNNFTLKAPIEQGRNKFYMRFDFGSWLQIWGYVKKDSFKYLMENSKENQSKWWDSNLLIAIKGNIRRYNLNRTRYGDCVILYLDNITFIHKNNNKK